MDIPILSDIYNVAKKGASFLLKQSIKPLSFHAYIRPLSSRVQAHLESKYGKSVIKEQKYGIEIGDKGLVYERGRYRLYVPYNEAVFGLTENRESILIQELIKVNLLPEMTSVDKSFAEGLCVFETIELIEKQIKGFEQSNAYYSAIIKNNPDNEYIEIIPAMDEAGRLKPLVEQISSEIKKEKSTIHQPTARIHRIRAWILDEKEKAKDRIIADIDKSTDSEMIKASGPSKSFFDHSRDYSEQQIVESIIKDKPITFCRGKDISYCSIARLTLQQPGLTASKMQQKLQRPRSVVQYGIVALLEHKNGLGLVKRIKGESYYQIYPTEKFKNLLKDKGYMPEQKELKDY
jgi:hypothetical protein